MPDKHSVVRRVAAAATAKLWRTTFAQPWQIATYAALHPRARRLHSEFARRGGLTPFGLASCANTPTMTWMDSHGRDQFDRAYACVSERIREGFYFPGAPMAAKEVAAALRISQTPVREALARLAGQGLIDERRGSGYFALALTANDIGDLYLLRHLYVDAVVVTFPYVIDRIDWAAAQSVPAANAAAALFTSLVAAARVALLVEAAGSVAERLLPVAPAEIQILGTSAAELAELCDAGSVGDRAKLRRALSRFYRRRRDAAVRIAAALRLRP